MRRFTRIILFGLIFCQLIGALASCQDKKEENAAFELTKEQLASYSIVVSYYADESVQSIANTLQSMIEQAVGVKLEIKKDYHGANGVDPNETEYEILLGKVARAEVSSFYADLKKEDAGYALVGKKLLILGYESTVLNKSVRHFKAQLLDQIDSLKPLLKAGDQSIDSGSYSYETLLINGTDIKNFKIVYPYADRQGESKIAANLSDWITQQTGYILPYVNDESEVGSYEIQIGDTARITDAMRADRNAASFGDGTYYIGASNGNVWLSGNDRTALYLAFSKFLELPTVSENTLKLDITPSSWEIKEFTLSVMNYNVYYDLSEPLRNPNDVIVCLKEKNADVFGLNEAGKDWIDKINSDQEIKEKYTCVTGKALENSSAASYNPIYFKKDKLELIEWGTKWLSDRPDLMSKYPDAKHYKGFTFVILKEKATGTQFMYINVHLDGSNDTSAHSALREVRKKQAEVLKQFIAKYSELPIVVGGDFNEGPSSAVIAGMSNDTRIKYCANIAKKKVLVNSTDVNKTFSALGTATFDYLFVTGDSISVQLYEQWDNQIGGKYPSDHLPVYADITVYY